MGKGGKMLRYYQMFIRYFNKVSAQNIAPVRKQIKRQTLITVVRS